MIPALGAGGPGFKSPFGPWLFFVSWLFSARTVRQTTNKIIQSAKKLGDTRSWTKDLPDCSRMLYHWAISPDMRQWANTSIQTGVRMSKKNICQKWDLNPRPHTRTRILILHSLSRGQGLNLESGALDHSAILTVRKSEGKKICIIPSGDRTQDLWIRSPTRYPLR